MTLVTIFLLLLTLEKKFNGSIWKTAWVTRLIHTHTHTYVHKHTHTHAYTHVYTHTHAYTHMHTHTRTYTHTHTHTTDSIDHLST